MDVEVKHRLPRAWTHVEHRAVSCLDVAITRNLRRDQVTASDYFGVVGLRFIQSGKMLLRND